MTNARSKVFISYSHHDSRWLERLQVHLRPLERAREIDIWDDTLIQPGDKWREAIRTTLAMTRVGILLVSADFLASDFIATNELPPLLDAATNDGATILSVILSPCRFQQTPQLAQFQAVNSPSRTLASLPLAERESIWVNLVNAVEACFENRGANEGWLVRNENLLLASLSQLMTVGRNGGFLIASVGDYYVQFSRQGNTLFSEAVSNSFLSRKLHLSKKADETIRGLGFDPPPDAKSNYFRSDSITDHRYQLRQIASAAVAVLANAYEVGERSNLEIKLDLDG